MRDKAANLIWGLLLIAIGILIGGKVMGWIDFSVFFPGWWTLFLIVPAFLAIVRKGFGFMRFLVLLIGLALLLQQNGVIEDAVLEKMFLPTAFILLGLSILLGQVFGKSHAPYSGTRNNCATFGGNTIRFNKGEQFDGAKFDAVFGGLDIFLNDADIVDNAVIDASAIFGGIDIVVPSNVKVKVYPTSIFGGTKYHGRNEGDGPTLHVNALCMFGGVDIK